MIIYLSVLVEHRRSQWSDLHENLLNDISSKVVQKKLLLFLQKTLLLCVQNTLLLFVEKTLLLFVQKTLLLFVQNTLLLFRPEQPLPHLTSTHQTFYHNFLNST